MAGLQSFVLVQLAIFVFNTITILNGRKAVEYCVKPDEGESLCSDIPVCVENCYVLAHYNNRYRNISCVTTFFFLPEDHTLNSTTLIANVASIIFTSKHSKANIICSHYGGLSFKNITNITIEG